MTTEQEIRDIAKEELQKRNRPKEKCDDNFLWGVIVGAILYWLLEGI